MDEFSEYSKPRNKASPAVNASQEYDEFSGYVGPKTGDTPLQETTIESLARAVPRIAGDLYNSAYKGITSVPGLLEKGKTEVPGLIKAIINEPENIFMNAAQNLPSQTRDFFVKPAYIDKNIAEDKTMDFARQGWAGLGELGYKSFNIPHDLINYAANRLNLFPKDLNEQIQMGRMPSDTQGLINDQNGQPKHPGEALLRGLARNSTAILGGGKIADLLNPSRLTHGGIAKNVVREGDRQMNVHQNRYNRLFNRAESQGINNVPYNDQLVGKNIDYINQYVGPRQTESIDNFIYHPTLQNAQKAQSDLGRIVRNLEEKSKRESLTGAERNLYTAAEETQNHIKNNMFRDQRGNLNQRLLNDYNSINRSYGQNVVPYRYNKAIQDFTDNKITAKELVQSISGGEFRAKKGWSHPAIGLREKFPLLATGGATAYLSYLLGNKAKETDKFLTGNQ